MLRTRRPPRRTWAVVVLDLILAPLTAARRLGGTVRRLVTKHRRGEEPAPTRDGRRVRGVIVATVAAVAAGLLLGWAWLRGPTGSTSLGTVPPDGFSPTANGGTGPHGPQPGSAVEIPPNRQPPPVGGSPDGTIAPSAPDSDPSPTSGSPPRLTGRYLGEDGTLTGYPARVTISNPGSVPVDGWTVRITLPRRTLAVSGVHGATVTQDGAVWTFTPTDQTREVPAGGAVEVRFRVNGTPIDSTPTNCTVDGDPCTGLPG